MEHPIYQQAFCGLGKCFTKVEVKNFHQYEMMRLVSHNRASEVFLLYAKNPYGSHNLVLARYNGEEPEAFCHGTRDCLQYLAETGKKSLYHKALRFIGEKEKEKRLCYMALQLFSQIA